MTDKETRPKKEDADPALHDAVGEQAKNQLQRSQPAPQAAPPLPATAEVATEVNPGAGTRALRFDWQDWLPWLEDDSIPEDQKRALIETLWTIVTAFVDLGWSVDSRPEHRAADGAESCGYRIDLKAVLEQAVLRSAITATAEETRHE